MAQNYTLGRGKVYFAPFKAGTQVPDNYRYIGNTPSMSMTIETENLDHFSSDEGVREKDDSVALQTTRTGQMTTDNIHVENLALFFFGESSPVTEAGSTDEGEMFESVIPDRHYQVGISEANPVGDRLISSVVVSEAYASLELSFSGTGTENDTITIDEVVYTLKDAPSAPNEIDVGASAALTAANLIAAITGGAGEGTAYGTGTEAATTFTAEQGTTTADVLVTSLVAGPDGDHPVEEAGTGASWAGAATDLARVAYTVTDDYVVTAALGMIEIVDGGGIAEGADIWVAYDVDASTQERVLSGSTPVEGALRFIAANPKGTDYDYVFPWVKLTPNGDFQLKGEEWQAIPFNLEFLKPTNSEAIYINGRPAATP